MVKPSDWLSVSTSCTFSRNGDALDNAAVDGMTAACEPAAAAATVDEVVSVRESSEG